MLGDSASMSSLGTNDDEDLIQRLFREQKSPEQGDVDRNSQESRDPALRNDPKFKEFEQATLERRELFRSMLDDKLRGEVR